MDRGQVELAAEQAARRLEARQLIVAGEDQTVRLAHPLYGEAIRATCGPLRTREVLRKLADAVAARGTPTREETLRIAVWRLDSGTADDPALLTAACRTARLVRDLELAVRLGRAAVAAGGGVESALLLASVLGHADRHDEADAVMAEVAGQPMGDLLRAEYEVLRAVTLHWRHGRGTEACAALDAAAEEMTGLEARQGVMILQAAILTDYGKHTEAGEVLARIRASGPLTYIPRTTRLRRLTPDHPPWASDPTGPGLTDRRIAG